MTNYLVKCAGVLMSIGACFAAQSPEPKRVVDKERLDKKISEAIVKKIAIEKIEDFVGMKATVNTIRVGDEDVLASGNLIIDTQKSQIKKLNNVKHVVYWIYDLNTGSPKAPEGVGVAWTKKNEMKLFYCILEVR